MTTDDFDLRIWSEADKYVAQVIYSPAGPSRRETLQAPFGSDPRDRALFFLKLENAVLRGGSYRGQPVSREERVLREFGALMFRNLLRDSGSIVAAYNASRARGGSLRMKLTVEPPELAMLP